MTSQKPTLRKENKELKWIIVCCIITILLLAGLILISSNKSINLQSENEMLKEKLYYYTDFEPIIINFTVLRDDKITIDRANCLILVDMNRPYKLNNCEVLK